MRCSLGCLGLSVLFFWVSVAGFCANNTSASKEVVVYTSLDKVFSEPVLQEFQKQTGIKVKAVYDSEATKTTGLVNRLIAGLNKCTGDSNKEKGFSLRVCFKFIPFAAKSGKRSDGLDKLDSGSSPE